MFNVGDKVTINERLLNDDYEFDPTEVFTITSVSNIWYYINAKMEKSINSGKWIITKDDGPISSVRTLSSSILPAQRRNSIDSML